MKPDEHQSYLTSWRMRKKDLFDAARGNAIVLIERPPSQIALMAKAATPSGRNTACYWIADRITRY